MGGNIFATSSRKASSVKVGSIFCNDNMNLTWIEDNAAKALSLIDSIKRDWELFGNRTGPFASKFSLICGFF